MSDLLQVVPSVVPLLVTAAAAATALGVLCTLPRSWFSTHGAALAARRVRGTVRRQALWSGVVLAFTVFGSLALTGWVAFAAAGSSGMLAFGAMVIGMMAHWVIDGRQRARGGEPLPLDLAGLIVPLVVAPIVFASVLVLSKREGGGPDLLLLSFQNGFFWKAILKTRHPPEPQ